MKKLLITIAFMMIAGLTLIAQQPPHPNQGSAPGSENSPVGGGAPIDGGITVLMVLATAYAFKKTGIVFFNKKNQSL
jgi:hypothetical protein